VGDPTIRRYITCPDCGRSAPDAGGRCADCHDTLDAGRKMAVNGELVKLADAMFAALDAYRERMAQGVARG
jgi:hypothetical protein